MPRRLSREELRAEEAKRSGTRWVSTPSSDGRWLTLAQKAVGALERISSSLVQLNDTTARIAYALETEFRTAFEKDDTNPVFNLTHGTNISSSEGD